MREALSLKKRLCLVLFLLIFASAQFFLLLRHKNAFISDSYFYEQTYYQFRGMAPTQAYQKIISQIELKNTNPVSQHIFSTPTSYFYSYSFFQKRLLYPFLAFIVSFVNNNPYIDLLIPNFLGYLGLILISFVIISEARGDFFATLATTLFISFYPFLDWSTYLLTDTIGAFLWLTQILLVYKFLKTKNSQFLITQTLVFILSLLNREQNVLMALLVLLLSGILYLFKFPKITIRQNLQVIGLIGGVTFLYFLISALTGQKSLFDTLVYNQNNYGLTQNSFTFSQTLHFLLTSIIQFHKNLISDLSQRHWSLVFLILSIFGIVRVLKNKPSLLDLIILCSTLTSYLFVFIFPIFSYRYYYPVILGLIYYALAFSFDFFS